MNSLSIINPAEKATSLSNISNVPHAQEQDAIDEMVNEKAEVSSPVHRTKP